MKYIVLVLTALLLNTVAANAAEYPCKEDGSCSINAAPPSMEPQPGFMPPPMMPNGMPNMAAPPTMPPTMMPGMMPQPVACRAFQPPMMEHQQKIMEEAEANNRHFAKILSTWERQQKEYQHYLDSLKGAK